MQVVAGWVFFRGKEPAQPEREAPQGRSRSALPRPSRTESRPRGDTALAELVYAGRLLRPFSGWLMVPRTHDRPCLVRRPFGVVPGSEPALLDGLRACLEG
jgi:hypothetical protein